MPRQVDDALQTRIVRHYQWCTEVLRACDVDGFLAWLGQEGTFLGIDGATVRVAETRPFWVWRFSNVLEVRQVQIEIENVAWNDEGLVVVDFHEHTNLTVRGFDGTSVLRDADLPNRNLWEISEDRLTTRGGEEIEAQRTLNGRPLTDDIDPWGFGAWTRHQKT